jgi:DNA repair exonuclease SbcCD nuclease subunit
MERRNPSEFLASRPEQEKKEAFNFSEVRDLIAKYRSTETFAKKREAGMSAEEAEEATTQEAIKALLNESDRFSPYSAYRPRMGAPQE